jgi:hypothetical protein
LNDDLPFIAFLLWDQCRGFYLLHLDFSHNFYLNLFQNREKSQKKSKNFIFDAGFDLLYGIFNLLLLD